MSTVDIAELRRLVERLAIASTNTERAHWWDVNADKVAAYLPIVLDELEQLRRAAAGWLPPDEAERLTKDRDEAQAALREWVHAQRLNELGLIRKIHDVEAQLAAVQPVIDAARAYREARYTSAAGAAGDALVAALDLADSPPEGPTT